MKKFFLVVLTLTLFLSCQSRPKKRAPLQATPDVKKELDQVQVDLAANNKSKALARLERLIKAHPETDAADDALMLMGQIHYQNHEFSKAYDSFISIVTSEIFSPQEAEALLWSARSLYRLGRTDEALSLTNESIQIPGISEKVKAENYKLRFSILTQMGDRLDALKALIYLAEKDTEEKNRSAYRMKALDFVESQLSPEELSKVASQRDFGFARTPAMFRLGKMFFEQRDFRRARSYLSEVVSSAPDSDLAEQSLALITQIDARRQVNPKTIGAVLPISGKHAHVAYRTLKGLQLGLGIYGKNKSDFRLAVIDSEGNPDQARRAVERLVTEDHVIAIAGSLLSKTSMAVASKADELGVPSVNLSQRAGITEVGGTVFRNSVTSEMQVRHLVNEAMGTLGIKRFAILYPNDPYGVEYANLFWDEVLARGGQITAAQTYDPSTTNFSGPVQRMVGTYYLEDRLIEYKSMMQEWLKANPSARARENMPSDLLPPVVDFEALFVPDSIRALSQIAPTLAYLDIGHVRLLGTNIWNSTALVQKGERHVESALFVDSLLQTDPRFRDSDFFREFQAVFGEEPGVFEAQGYDTGIILRTLVASGERTRIGLAQAFEHLPEMNGALGTLSVDDKREVNRRLVSFTVHEGKISRFDEVLKAEEVPPRTPGKKKTR